MCQCSSVKRPISQLINNLHDRSTWRKNAVSKGSHSVKQFEEDAGNGSDVCRSMAISEFWNVWHWLDFSETSKVMQNVTQIPLRRHTSDLWTRKTATWTIWFRLKEANGALNQNSWQTNIRKLRVVSHLPAISWRNFCSFNKLQLDGLKITTI